ncbi:MAG TPA: hypothetical protein VGS27_32590 [Candidatus Sulfotelmatobacter sp.]|nr:hypothetical protein [Candidatus Sulfotelmatobacter sp.]
MLRHLYRCALRLHPPGFRKRFGDEMLSVLDEEASLFTRIRLLLDCLRSLGKQWALRHEFWFGIPSRAAVRPVSGGPSFSSLDPFRPRTSAVIHGMVLSITLFSLTCFAIRYSWIHVLHVQIPEVAFDPYLAIHPAASPSELRGTRAPAVPQQSTSPANDEDSHLISPHLQIDVMPVEADRPKPSLEASDQIAQSVSSSATGASRSGTVLQIDLHAYVGTYVSRSPQVKISISIRDGNLLMKIADEPRRTLTPLSETAFVSERGEYGRIEFFPDAKGRMSQLQLLQKGRRITADRQ